MSDKKNNSKNFSHAIGGFFNSAPSVIYNGLKYRVGDKVKSRFNFNEEDILRTITKIEIDKTYRSGYRVFADAGDKCESCGLIYGNPIDGVDIHWFKKMDNFTDENIIEIKQNKYDISILNTCEKHMNDKLQEYQENGWEIAGDIKISDDKHSNQSFVNIPLKKLKENENE